MALPVTVFIFIRSVTTFVKSTLGNNTQKHGLLICPLRSHSAITDHQILSRAPTRMSKLCGPQPNKKINKYSGGGHCPSGQGSFFMKTRRQQRHSLSSTVRCTEYLKLAAIGTVSRQSNYTDKSNK